ncbi:MAG: ATP-binding protein [Clostridiales Family XIII bacterium]|nr:ATP-binding protein [Clostridiales Family XIII bacterium]
MKIIGRTTEKDVLQQCLDSKKPEFLAVYGRRRVGKTFLVREYFGDHIVFSMTGAIKTSMKRQLKNFDEMLEEYSQNPAAVSVDWFEAFRSLKAYIKRLKGGRKKVIFFDELPWLATQKSGFVSALDYFWNSFGSARADLLLVICGSATSWIIDNIIKDRGGLHNRVTRQLWIEPFSLRECEQFYKEKNIELSRIQIAELFMIFGGIPYYMDYIEKGLSPEQNIDRIFFKKGAPLANEFSNLYAALFKNPDNHLKVIETLGKIGSGMTQKELFAEMKVNTGGRMTKVLEELEQCGFVRSYQDFTKKKNGRYYQLLDFYTLFYLKHIKGRVSPDGKYWQNQSRQGGWHAWNGLAFERVCVAHVEQIKNRLGISGVSADISAWRSKHSSPKVQIDLIINRDDGIINLCEMKFTEKAFAIDREYDEELLLRRETFREETGTKKALHITMVTANGLTSGSYIGMVQAQVLLDDLFTG